MSASSKAACWIEYKKLLNYKSVNQSEVITSYFGGRNCTIITEMSLIIYYTTEERTIITVMLQVAYYRLLPSRCLLAWGNAAQTESPYNLPCRVHNDLFLLLNAAQLYCPVNRDLGVVHSGLWRVQQWRHRGPVCIPWTENPIPVLDPHSPPFIFN